MRKSAGNQNLLPVKNNNPSFSHSVLFFFIFLLLLPGRLQAEDWSFSDWLDDLTLFGSARFRPEIWTNQDFNRKTDDTTDLVGSKIQFGLAKKLAENTTMVLRLQDSRLWGGSPGSDTGFSTANRATEESVDVREAFIQSDELIGPFGFKMGRQILNYGSGRQLGANEWNNVGRSFDAMEFHWTWGIWNASVFGALLAEEDNDGTGNTTAVGRFNSSGFDFDCDPVTGICSVQASTVRELDDAYMAGMYNELKFHPNFQAEPYYIGVYKKWIPATTSPFPGLPIPPKARERQRDNLHTFGIRFTNKTVDGKSASSFFDYSVEVAYQTGYNGERQQARWDILDQRDPAGNPVYTERKYYDAYAAFADIGIRPVDFMRIGFMGDVASGDPDRTDMAVATYSQLFPSYHAPLGDMDLIGSRNVIARGIRLDFSLAKYGNLKLAYWHYRKHKIQDSYYDNGGRVAVNEDGDPLSTESQGNLKYSPVLDSQGKITEHTSAQLSSQLFHEYNITYGFNTAGLEFRFGYGLAHALSSVRNRVDENFNRYDLQNRAFDPRSQFGYFMLTAKF